MLRGVNAQGKQGIQIKFLWVAGVRFENNLVLEELLKPIGGVDAVASVIGGAHGRLKISHFPGFGGAQHAQEGGGGVHGAGTDLGIVGLPNQTALPGPVSLELENNVLKI